MLTLVPHTMKVMYAWKLLWNNYENKTDSRIPMSNINSPLSGWRTLRRRRDDHKDKMPLGLVENNWTSEYLTIMESICSTSKKGNALIIVMTTLTRASLS